jgi:2-succinyl-5-enolpyruvyl-6-hydroxy-3-cyclohexene-1-carboxylate synthase
MSVGLDFRNVNSLWGSVLVETLARCGVKTAVVSPGSRSTPLTIVFAQHGGIEAIPVLDERSAAFFALGLAKQQRRPVVLLCTSGTAGANYFPAIIEAQESGVPLLVITADRPPEMRDCASGQTIDQQKLFGAHVNFFHEYAVPAATLPMLQYLRQTTAQAVMRTLAPSPGPVHLNAPFRDPLPPIADGSVRALEGKIDETFFAHLEPPWVGSVSSTIWQRATTARGLIVAGPAAPDDAARYSAHVHKLAASLGWPVLADALSPVRTAGSVSDVAAGLSLRTSPPTVVTTYDAILRNATLARDLAPRTVLCLGGWPTSKILRAWLESSGAEIVLVSNSTANRDALHGRTRQICAPVESLAVSDGKVADDSYRKAWMSAESATRAALDSALEADSTLFEGKAAWLMARSMPERTRVFVASSMPIRDVEYFWPANGRDHEIVFSRGANGIDGTLSTALGVAHGGAPAVLLTGDLALLHDANGFLLRPKFRGSLTIVLINNCGGGIFEHLPVASFDPPFEEFFATPQQVDFGALCAAHGVEHVLMSDWTQFTALIEKLPLQGIRVLELRTDRKRDAATRKRLLASVAR